MRIRQAIVSAVLLIVVISILCELHEVLFHDWSARIYMYEAGKTKETVEDQWL